MIKKVIKRVNRSAMVSQLGINQVIHPHKVIVIVIVNTLSIAT